MSGNWKFLSPYWDPISASAKDLISHMIVLGKKKNKIKLT